MPATTTLGINHPVGPDRYNATNAFTTLATTTDAAIRRAVEEHKGSMTEYVDTSVADNRQWVENVVAASALGDMTPEQVDAAVERVLNSSAWKDRQAEVVHVRDFGAKGDGITDDSAAIQAAIDTGRNVEFSNTPYRITKGFTVPSGTVLNGNGAQLVSTGNVGNVFTIAGSASGTTVNLAGNYNSGDALLRTVTPHGLTEGDVFRLVGQRASASSDAPTDDRLGMSTGNSGVPWFGEYVRVRKVLSPTEFTTMSGLIFNGYRDNRLQETVEAARERTTLNRMNWASDIVVRDFEIDTASTYAFRMDYAKDCIISNVREKRRANTGYVVGATGCYRCLVADVQVDFVSPIPDGFTNYWLRNPFKLMGCQSVSIDRCSADGGEQVVDFTYISSAMIPTIACSVRNCTFYGYDSNAVTAHPGVWGSVIENNDFRAANTVKTASANGSAVASGIGIRSPYSVIRGNLIRTDQRNEGTSDGNSGNYGINLYDGGGHHCQVTGNQVYGPDIGIGVTDGNESPERHGTLYTMIDGNYVEDAMVGIRLRKSSLTNVWSAATIQGNYVASKWNGATGISLDMSGTGKTKAASAIGNRLHFTGTNPTPFHLGAAVDPVLVSNVVTGTASSLWSGDKAPVMAANVVISPSGVTQYPEPGATGSVSVSADAVSGAYQVGAGSSSVRVPSVDGAGALTGATRSWVEGLVSNAANLGEALTVAEDARAAAERAEQAASESAPGIAAEPAGSGYSLVLRDSIGRMSELTLDEQGRFPQWVLDRWADRLPRSGAVDRRDALVSAFKARRGGRIGTGGRPVVTLRFDHGLTTFKTTVLPLLRERGLPSMNTMNSRTWADWSNSGMSQAEARSAWINDAVEFTNHGATHDDAASPAAVRDNIVTGLAELQGQFPDSVVEGFAPAGVTGTRYMGFNEGSTAAQWADTLAGQLVMGHHAACFGYATGVYRAPAELDVGAAHATIDAQDAAWVKALIRGAVASRSAMTLMLHPVRLDTTGYMSTADFTAVLDDLAARRDAGEILVTTPTGSLLLDPTTSWRHDLIPGGWGVSLAAGGSVSRVIGVGRLASMRGGMRDLETVGSGSYTVQVSDGGPLSLTRNRVGSAHTPFSIPVGSQSITVTITATTATALTVTAPVI